VNTIQIFNHPEFGDVRTVLRDKSGEIWFVGKDVAEVLGYKNASHSVMIHVQEDDRMLLNYKAYRETREASQLWQGQDFSDKVIINESGLYSLIFSSKLPQAKEFKHWVTSEVLPQIRKTGGYIPISDLEEAEAIAQKTIDILKRTLDDRNLRLAEREADLHEKMQIIAYQRRQLRLQRPQVEFAEALTASEDSILLRDLAKLLTQNGVVIGQNRLFGWMRRHGYIFQNGTRPIQHWVEQGIFDTNVSVVNSHRRTRERLTTRVTGKGQRYFLRLFLTGMANAG